MIAGNMKTTMVFILSLHVESVQQATKQADLRFQFTLSADQRGFDSLDTAVNAFVMK